MRFVMLMYPGPQAETERSPVPDGPEGQKLLEDMMAFNQRMVAEVLKEGFIERLLAGQFDGVVEAVLHQQLFGGVEDAGAGIGFHGQAGL